MGGSAYKLHDNLMIPYRDNGHLTERQKNYNFCHASARIVIERVFGLLKGRFRSLLTKLAMDRIDLIPKYILACCILHNICLMRGDELEVEINQDVQPIDREGIENRNINNASAAKRYLICERLRIRNV